MQVPHLSAAFGALVVALVLVSTGPARGGPGDADNDGIPDLKDSCVLDSRNAIANCDHDGDGYGNPCDADFDQNGTVSPTDFTGYFMPAFKGQVSSARGQDMDCNGSVLATDFTRYFIPKFKGALGGARPGPSKCTP